MIDDRIDAQSASRVRRAVVLARQAERSGRRSRGSQTVAREAGSSYARREARRWPVARRDGRPRGRARRRRHDAPGAPPFPRHRRPRHRRQLRPGRLPHVDPGRRARAGLRRVFAGEYRSSSCPRSARPSADAGSWRSTTSSRERRARPHGELGGRSAETRAARLRRRHLRHAVGLDGATTSRTEAPSRVGARRDGDHVRRAALAARPAARGPARPERDRLEPHHRCGATVLVDGHRWSSSPGGRVGPDGRAALLLATLPEATFFCRYQQTFAA